MPQARELIATAINVIIHNGVPFVINKMQEDGKLKEMKTLQKDRMEGMANLVKVQTRVESKEPERPKSDADSKAGAYLRESAPALYKAILQKTTS